MTLLIYYAIGIIAAVVFARINPGGFLEKDDWMDRVASGAMLLIIATGWVFILLLAIGMAMLLPVWWVAGHIVRTRE